MATRYALQHRTTSVFISEHPMNGLHTSAEVGDAVSWGTQREAELHLDDLDGFAEAWQVVPVDVLMQSDSK
jgi:hypothetical protein